MLVIRFLSEENIIEICKNQISIYGGDYGLTARGLPLLQSAVGVPPSGHSTGYYHEFPHEMAACYLYHLSSNHPFEDGNKRTATVAAVVFLNINYFELTASNEEIEQLVFGVAEGRLSKNEVIKFFKTYVAPMSQDS